MDLSEKIRLLRMKKGLSQEELAEQIGVSRQSVSKWESGQTSPEISKLMKMANVFEISTDELLDPEIKEFRSGSNDSDHNQGSTQSIYERKKYARGYQMGRDLLFCSLIIFV